MRSVQLIFFLLLLVPSSSCLRLIGYWGSTRDYANQSSCSSFTTDQIPAELYTHIIFAFATIKPDHTVEEPSNDTIELINQVQQLKSRNKNLKVMVSLGGWNMDMSLYSSAVSTQYSRTAMTNSIMNYTRTWNWDGVDFDWEYPNDPERGGTPDDGTNFVLFIEQMRNVVDSEIVPVGKSKLILSIPLPGGSWHGQYYYLGSMLQHLDFANIMAYNLHGPWEDQVYCSANFYDNTPANSRYHGYSIFDAVTYFLNQNGSKLPAYKFNLGVTFAGVAFTLTNPSSSNPPGSAASGEGVGGNCTREAGYMAFFEVEKLISTGIVNSTSLDPIGVCKYFTYNTNQWIGYDDDDTLSQKVTLLVKNLGLGGVSIWAMYAESATGPLLQTSIAKTLFLSGKPTESDFSDENNSGSSTTSPDPPASSSSSLSPPSIFTTSVLYSGSHESSNSDSLVGSIIQSTLLILWISLV